MDTTENEMILTQEQAKAALDVQPPEKVYARLGNGEAIDEDGEKIEDVMLAPWVMALGPFGSWPEAADQAFASLEEKGSLYLGKSFRIGPCVVWDRGWGYAIRKEVFDRAMEDHQAGLVGAEMVRP
jgi:hypothetical protein